jgi:hypothetical protein
MTAPCEKETSTAANSRYGQADLFGDHRVAASAAPAFVSCPLSGTIGAWSGLEPELSNFGVPLPCHQSSTIAGSGGTLPIGRSTRSRRRTAHRTRQTPRRLNAFRRSAGWASRNGGRGKRFARASPPEPRFVVRVQDRLTMCGVVRNHDVPLLWSSNDRTHRLLWSPWSIGRPGGLTGARSVIARPC